MVEMQKEDESLQRPSMATYKSIYEPETESSAGEDEGDMDDDSDNRNGAEEGGGRHPQIHSLRPSSLPWATKFNLFWNSEGSVSRDTTSSACFYYHALVYSIYP